MPVCFKSFSHLSSLPHKVGYSRLSLLSPVLIFMSLYLTQRGPNKLSNQNNNMLLAVLVVEIWQGFKVLEHFGTKFRQFLINMS